MALLRRQRPRPAPGSRAAAWRENIESLVWAVALAMVIRTFIAAPFKIPSGSMHPTLVEGDRILVNKFLYWFQDPKPGDIIVFRYPEDPKRPFIKRLAAVGGQTIQLRGGHPMINGTAIQGQGMLATNYYYNQGAFGQERRPVRVPEDAYFVLGDNSLSSHDSRFWGFVPRRLVIGRAICIFWPITRWRFLR